ncbi:hypothetical protein GP486_005514 [Trichoglossum hirsutum]|uniref:Mid2 domain-containing protein n=1 Tax=Trichoglossum hirsutum TaxID=265104 RepID=A0A9P8L923_9PEZI|nr:hypothetical protein GP486_005514 [Trichoglossum hirsutum]
MEHPSKRQRLSRAAGNGGAIGADSKGNGGSTESHVANTDDDEAMEHRRPRFGEPHATGPAILRHRTPRIAKAPSVDQAGAAIGTRQRELRRRLAQDSLALDPSTLDSPALDSPVSVTEIVSISVAVADVDAGSTQEETTSSTTTSSDPGLQLPTVPSVPAFPTFTLPTVPAYPFTSTSSPTLSPTSSPSFPSFGNSTSIGLGCNCTTTASSNSTLVTSTSLLNSTTTSTTFTTSSTEASTTSSTETGISTSTESSGGNLGGGGPATSTGANSTPTSGAGPGSGTGLSVQKPAVIGGIVGGLAGIALILILMLLIIRSKKEKMRRYDLEPASNPANRVSSTPSDPAGLLRRFRPSQQPVETSEITPPGERGFYKVSGRKIPPVLGGGGGDGFGGGYDETPGPGPPGGRGVIESSGSIVAIRPSPARTPVVSHSPTRESSQGRLPRPPRSPFRDGLGRSHPSEDGSKASRFVEDV